MFEWLMDFGVECNQQCTINPGNQSASIFYVPRFSASNEPAGFDGNVFFCRIGGRWWVGGGGEKGVKVLMQVSRFLLRPKAPDSGFGSTSHVF